MNWSRKGCISQKLHYVFPDELIDIVIRYDAMGFNRKTVSTLDHKSAEWIAQWHNPTQNTTELVTSTKTTIQSVNPTNGLVMRTIFQDQKNQYNQGVTINSNRNHLMVCNPILGLIIIDCQTSCVIEIIKNSNLTYRPDFPFQPQCASFDMSGQLLFITDPWRKLLIFDAKTNQFVRQVDDQLLLRPHGVTMNSNNNLVVCDKNENKIVVYDHRSFVRTFERLKVYLPHDICYFDDKVFYSCVKPQSNNQGELVETIDEDLFFDNASSPSLLDRDGQTRNRGNQHFYGICLCKCEESSLFSVATGSFNRIRLYK